MLSESRVCYVYHICRIKNKMSYNFGYIGVSFKPEIRWNHHKNRSENPHLRNALYLYTDICYYIVYCGTEDECYHLEEALRPVNNIGWNINKGGSSPPNPKGTPYCIGKIEYSKRRKNYKHSEETKKKLILHNKINKKLLSKIKIGKNNPMFAMYGSKNPNFSFYYITPEGIFESQMDMALFYGLDKNSILRRLNKIDEPIKQSRWQAKEFWGRSWRELGWYKIEEGKMKFEEVAERTGWKLPRVYSFGDINDLKSIVENLPNLKEGVVLLNRGVPKIKIKSSIYVISHRLRGENCLSGKRIMDLIIMNETDEYLSIFPEDKERFDPYIDAKFCLRQDFNNTWEIYSWIEDQKQFALKIKDLDCAGLLFMKKARNGLNFQECFDKLNTKSKYRLLEMYLT